MCGQGRKFSFTQEAAEADTDVARSLRLEKEDVSFLATMVAGFKTELKMRASLS